MAHVLSCHRVSAGLSREAPPGEDLAEDAHAGMDATSSSGAQGSHDDLLRNLRGIDGRPYGAYKSLCGAWAFPGFQLLIHHVQTDPFAPPSRCSVRVGGFWNCIAEVQGHVGDRLPSLLTVALQVFIKHYMPSALIQDQGCAFVNTALP